MSLSTRAGSMGLIAAFALFFSNAWAQSDWPSFRNGGSGITRVSSVPQSWSPETVTWQTAVDGYGQSAPVVKNGKVFLTSTDGPWQEKGLVHALDLKTGKRLWTSQVTTTSQVENYFRNSRAAPTPVVDNDCLFTFFPSGDVTAFDHDGKQLWTVPLFERFGKAENERGTASSLAQSSHLIFVLVDHAGPSYLVALRKSDGSLAWKADRGERVESWTSPIWAKFGGNECVVVSSADSVHVYDANSGIEIWKQDDLAGNHIPSATIEGNSIFIGSTQTYGSTADTRKVAGSNCRIDFRNTEPQPTFETVWGAERANSYYSTPLAFAGYVYYVNKSGILFCIDQTTGARRFVQRLGAPCWASAIGVTTGSGEKLVYFVQKNGITIVLRPGDTFDMVARSQLWNAEQMLAAARVAKKQRARNSIPPDQTRPKSGPEQMLAAMPEKSLHKMFSYGDPIAYAATIVDETLLIRTGQDLYCIRIDRGQER